MNAAGGAGGVLGLCGVVGAGYDSQWDSVKLNEGVHAVGVSSERSEWERCSRYEVFFSCCRCCFFDTDHHLRGPYAGVSTSSFVAQRGMPCKELLYAPEMSEYSDQLPPLGSEGSFLLAQLVSFFRLLNLRRATSILQPCAG